MYLVLQVNTFSCWTPATTRIEESEKAEIERGSQLVINLPQLLGSDRRRECQNSFWVWKEVAEGAWPTPCDWLLLFKSTCHIAGQSRCGSSTPPPLHLHTHILRCCIATVEGACVTICLVVCVSEPWANRTKRTNKQESIENDRKKTWRGGIAKQARQTICKKED